MTENAKQFLTDRKRVYQKAFTGVDGERLMDDLKVFCRADESTYARDPRDHALLEGRREVYLRIMKHLNLSPDELVAYYKPKGE